jgi:heme oxygenase
MTTAQLTSRLKEATLDLHREAERAGVMGALLRGEIELRQYVLMLRNLHALYEALEDGLDRNAGLPEVAPIRMPAMYRAAPLAADMRHLHGVDWVCLPLAPAIRSYVAQIAERSRSRPELLAAHAYVRYMGDLSGGQVLRQLVRRVLALGDGPGTAFYTFAGVTGGASIKGAFRDALDSLQVDERVAREMVAEARASFALHVRLFEELGTAPLQPSSSVPAA